VLCRPNHNHTTSKGGVRSIALRTPVETTRIGKEFKLNPQPCQIVLTTCPDQSCAERIAGALVAEGLVACANILPAIRSIYKWRGEINSVSEHLLLLKGLTNKYSELQTRILELHPYELPEIVAVPIADGLDRYLAWLSDPDPIQ